eukprot:554777-Rhodomonas_salina.1
MHGRGWWFQFWDLGRAILVGVILAAVSNAEGNAGTIVAIGVVDTALMIIFHPFGDWQEIVKNLYRGIMNIVLNCPPFSTILVSPLEPPLCLPSSVPNSPSPL